MDDEEKKEWSIGKCLLRAILGGGFFALMFGLYAEQGVTGYGGNGR
jgi:hypothetical protein